MTKPFETTEEFSSLFELKSHPQYREPIVLDDRKVGFSIKRDYPDNIRYKPAINRNNTPDNIATIWVIYTHPQEANGDMDLKKIPIIVRVCNMSLYRVKHFDYDFSDPDCPTEDSVERSRTTPKPIDLEYNNEFFFNHESNVFINELGNIIRGIDILDRAYSDHCDTIHWIKGFKLRLKLFAREKAGGLLSLIISFLKFILKTFFGRTLEEKDSVSSSLKGYKKESLKKLNEDSLNVFGYKAAKPVIIVFCGIVIIISLLRYLFNISVGYLSYVASNNILSISHGIFLLWILDAIVPNVIFFLINVIIKFRTKIIFMKLKGP
jgi:hypothetical protein